MKAIVFDLDRTVQLQERPEPKLLETSVLIRPSYVGICGTDLHAETLDHFRPGVIMGHEFSGRVVASGGSARRFVEGDLVVVNPNGNLCGHCDACRSGRINLCASAVFEHGIGIHEDGGMAELVAVDEKVLFAVPAAVTEQQAAWVEPLATAVRAVRRASIAPTSSAVVLGAGPIGLLVTQLLVGVGASSVGVVEPSPYRREIALRLGAGSAVSPTNSTSAPMPPADVVFECSGSVQGFETALTTVRLGGTIIVVGLAPEPLALEPFALVGRELRIQGSIIYDSDDFGGALELLETRKVDVDVLTTDVMPLAQYNDAFGRLRDPEASALKILLHP